MKLPLRQFLVFVVDFLVVEARAVAASRAAMLAIRDDTREEYRERVAQMVGLDRDVEREEAESKAYAAYQERMGLA